MSCMNIWEWIKQTVKTLKQKRLALSRNVNIYKLTFNIVRFANKTTTKLFSKVSSC